MPRRFKKNSRSRRGRWRQQKLAIGTVQKIAKQVAKYEIKKKLEPKYSITLLGEPSQAIDGHDLVALMFRSGLYVPRLGPVNLTQNSLTGKCHHPQTVPATIPVGVGPAPVPLQSFHHTRIGDTIEMTGLSISGWLTLGKDCPTAAVKISIYKSEQTISPFVPAGTYPFTLLPRCNEMVVRRSIPNTEKLNKVTSRRWVINHKAGETTTTFPIKIWVPFKGKRVKYNPGQPTDFPTNEASYMDDRYYAIFQSSVPDEVPGGGFGLLLPNAQYQDLLDRNVQFKGKFMAYYRDG